MTRRMTVRTALAVGLAAVAAAICAQQANLGYQDTPMLPGGKWHVHDGLRPQPKVIDPGSASTQDQAGKAPSDAVVLFDGTDLSKWTNDGRPPVWKVENGCVESKPGSGTLVSKDQFGGCQVHLEYQIPVGSKGSGQGRCNSGLFLMGQYEIQILDNYESQTYPDGQAASIYGQYPPMVNACRKQGEWQTLDVIFTAPTFADGKVVTPAYETIHHNGVLMHHHAEVLGPCAHRTLAKYSPHGPTGPIGLQDHGNAVRFRNIWVREVKGYDAQ